MATVLDDATYRAALKRAVEAKWRMDAAQAALDQAEDEWHQATIALDKLEDAPWPDVAGQPPQHS